MTNFIHVRPRRELRVAFARWAVAQQPKVRTVTAEAFAVPARLFTDMPEDLLRGSLVDGHPYVSPLDHEEPTAAAGPGAPELLGVAALGGFREAVPGQPLPEVPAEAYGPDSRPLPPAGFASLDDAPADGRRRASVVPHGERIVVGENGPETGVPLGDTSRDTGGDDVASGGDTATATEAVTSEDTPEDSSDRAGDTSRDPGRPYACGLCPRAFKSARGRASHRRQAHRKA